MKSKYKVGDTVTIKKLSAENSSSYRFWVNSNMAELAGKSFRILIVTPAAPCEGKIPDDGYLYKLDDKDRWSWASSMFEDSEESTLSCVTASPDDSSINAFIREKKCPELDFSL